jgi:hypothetical protein
MQLKSDEDMKPMAKKQRFSSAADIEAPTMIEYAAAWEKVGESFGASVDNNSVFVRGEKAWFVRGQYPPLLDAITNDTDRNKHIINGTAGIGKSSFLLYTIARLRYDNIPVLLWYHPRSEAGSMMLLLKSDGSHETAPYSYDKFTEWIKLISDNKSFFLVDGIVSFNEFNDPLTLIVARSHSCSLGYLEKRTREDRWLTVWSKSELVKFGQAIGLDLQDVEELVAPNFHHIGGIARFAYCQDAAKQIVDRSIASVNAKGILQIVRHPMTMVKGDQERMIDRLIHHIPPPSLLGIPERSFQFASEYVAQKVALKLCLESEITTLELLNTYKGIGDSASFRGTVYEAYAARKLAAGGTFSIKRINIRRGADDTELVLTPTSIHQKDSIKLDGKQYPIEEIKGKTVWSNPSYNLPALDAFMVQSGTCYGFQMTVGRSHRLDIHGIKAVLQYFDSVCHSKKQSLPTYRIFFVVPIDVYDNFSNTEQPFTEKGIRVDDSVSASVRARVEEWVLKI